MLADKPWKAGRARGLGLCQDKQEPRKAIEGMRRPFILETMFWLWSRPKQGSLLGSYQEVPVPRKAGTEVTQKGDWPQQCYAGKPDRCGPLSYGTEGDRGAGVTTEPWRDLEGEEAVRCGEVFGHGG